MINNANVALGLRAFVLFITACWMGACAHTFDRPPAGESQFRQTDTDRIFNRMLAVHGGEQLERLNDLNVTLSGQWRSLITRIQPLVTDHQYRVDSEERLLAAGRVYSALYRGPAGTKKVVRTRDTIQVFYNDVESFDEDVLQSTALTADAFFYFLLGPLSLAGQSTSFTRLSDVSENGRNYHRLYTVLEPGFGQSDRDELILWIDKQREVAYRMEITLQGFATTKGAWVDVTFLEFEKVDSFLLPVKFHERVRAPIAIHAHSWELTGLDINRDLTLDSLSGPGWQPDAAVTATPRKR